VERANADKSSDVSRRTALVTIGQAAISFGLPSRLTADTTTSYQLPPGVYEASRDHLSHALTSSGRFHAIPPGCPTDYITPRTEPYTPLFFSSPEFALLLRMTELILGQSPTAAQEVAEWIDLCVAGAESVRQVASRLDPSHRTLAVAYFGEARVTKLETAAPEKICREGFEWLSNTARDRGSDQFLSLTEQQQTEILNSISDQRTDKQSQNAGTRLFLFLKTEIVRGFYTSQAGLKELDFKGNAFYARSPGCTMKL
jgi:Gluconate 2-dehydrogenase subunit 3